MPIMRWLIIDGIRGDIGVDNICNIFHIYNSPIFGCLGHNTEYKWSLGWIDNTAVSVDRCINVRVRMKSYLVCDWYPRGDTSGDTIVKISLC